MRQKEEETSGITAAQQDVNVDRSEESWGSLHEQYEQMIGIKSNASTSTISAANQKKIEEEIFERSLSYEYFWRSLICVMIDSKKCTYWSD